MHELLLSRESCEWNRKHDRLQKIGRQGNRRGHDAGIGRFEFGQHAVRERQDQAWRAGVPRGVLAAIRLALAMETRWSSREWMTRVGQAILCKRSVVAATST